VYGPLVMLDPGPDSASARKVVDEDVLEPRLAALEEARSWSPRAVSRLEGRIRGGDDTELFRINPIAYAAPAGLAEAEAIDLFLHATKAGLFEMDWSVVCAGCGSTNRSVRKLEQVDPHVSCDVCQINSDADLDAFIQVGFTVTPAVRSIRFHDPASLTADDLYLRYLFSADLKRGEDGRSLADDLAAATHLLADLEPGERRTIELEATGFFVAIRDARHATSAMYWVTGEDGAPREIRATLRGGRFEDAGQALGPMEHDEPAGRFHWPANGRIAAGHVTATVENGMDDRAPIWIVQYPNPTGPLEPVEFEAMLSAKRLLSTQTFRDLFRSEKVPIDESIQVKDLTFLFTDLQGSTAMYDRIGDATAYNLVRLHFDTLEDCVRKAGGAIVKTIGDAVMAPFAEPVGGLRAAIAMVERLESHNRSASTALGLRVGLHRGPAITVTLNDQVDYFGQTVNIAARVEGLANAGEVALSEDIRRDPAVAAMLEGRVTERIQGLMKGVQDEIAVYRVRIATDAAAPEQPHA
jgi:class 3 adenylate cyclase